VTARGRGLGALTQAFLERLGLASGPAGDNAYHAFISYSHAVDGALAPALQRGLQRFAKPWYRARAVRVFRDEASLSANPGLWSSIERALESSVFFILLASPRAAASPWVMREAAQWHATKPTQNLLIGLTEGELVWDEAAGDFDWERTTALPETLRGAFEEEPRFIDLRWAHAGEQLSLSDARFRDAIADLAAPLYGVPKDVLAGEEVRQHRRTVRIARAAAVTLAALTLASILFGVFAVLQRNEARRQRDLATSRSLVQTANANLESRIDRAALLSLEAYRVQPSAEARGSMIHAIQRSEQITGLLHVDQPVERIALDADRARLAAAGTQSVALWSLGPPRQANGVLPVRGAKALVFRPDGELLAVGGPSAIGLWTLEPRLRLSRRIPFRGGTAMAFSQRGRVLSAVGPTSVSMFNVRTGARLRRQALGMSVSTAAFAPRGTLVAIGGLRTVRILDLTGERPPLRITALETPRALAFDTRGMRVAGVDLGGEGVTVWDTATGNVIERIPLRDTAETIAFGPQGQLVLGMTDGSVALRPDASTPPQVLRGPAERVLDIEFPTGGPLATAGEQGVIVLWDPTGSAFRRQLPALADPISDADFAEQASTLAVGGFGESVTVWTLEDGRPRRRTLRTGPVTAVAIDRAGSWVAVADQGVVLYDADGDRRALQAAGATSYSTLEFSGGDIVAWGMPRRVALWDAANGRRLEPLPTTAAPLGLDFSGGGNLLVVAGEGGTTLWDVTDRRSTELIGGQAVSAVGISRSGRVVASATPGEVVVTDAERGTARFAFQIPQGVSVKLSFSPDEKTLAVGTSEGRLLLVDAQSGRQLGVALSVPGGPVSGLDFSSDGTTLVTAAQGGSITLWDDLLWSDVPAMKRRLCGVAGRSLTPDEWRELVPGQSYRATCP
jgi:WD40 repeat protein